MLGSFAIAITAVIMAIDKKTAVEIISPMPTGDVKQAIVPTKQIVASVIRVAVAIVVNKR